LAPKVRLVVAVRFPPNSENCCCAVNSQIPDQVFDRAINFYNQRNSIGGSSKHKLSQSPNFYWTNQGTMGASETQ